MHTNFKIIRLLKKLKL